MVYAALRRQSRVVVAEGMGFTAGRTIEEVGDWWRPRRSWEASSLRGRGIRMCCGLQPTAFQFRRRGTAKLKKVGALQQSSDRFAEEHVPKSFCVKRGEDVPPLVLTAGGVFRCS